MFLTKIYQIVCVIVSLNQKIRANTLDNCLHIVPAKKNSYKSLNRPPISEFYLQINVAQVKKNIDREFVTKYY